MTITTVRTDDSIDHRHRNHFFDNLYDSIEALDTATDAAENTTEFHNDPAIQVFLDKARRALRDAQERALLIAT